MEKNPTSGGNPASTTGSTPGKNPAVKVGNGQREQPPPTAAFVITIGFFVLTANSIFNFVFGFQTLISDFVLVILSGTTFFLLSPIFALIINDKISALRTPQILAKVGSNIIQAFENLETLQGHQFEIIPASMIVINSKLATADSASQFIVQGQTLTADDTSFTISGKLFSLVFSGSNVLINEIISAFPTFFPFPSPVITIGGQSLTANFAFQIVVQGADANN